MKIHISRKYIEILYAFKDISNAFILNDSGKLFAIVDGHPLELSGISDECLEFPFD